MIRILPVILFFVFSMATSLSAFDASYEQAPINYSNTKPNDAIAKLQNSLNSGKLSLGYDESLGICRQCWTR